MKNKISITTILLLVVITACKKDFIVEDISKKTLTVNAPSPDLETDINTITFWWDPLDGAEAYNLQIVKPSFSKAVKLMLDTNLTATKFNFTFTPGVYQWRIKATNAGHSTAFQTFNIHIDTTSDLTEQIVNLLLPANGAITGNTVVTFSWKGLTAAKKYRFILNDGTLKDTTLVNSSLTCTLLAAKNTTTSFSWNVKAINDEGESQFNAAAFTLTIDRKGPGTPVLLFPGLTATVSGNSDSLKWSRGSADVVYDSVYVSDDSTFFNLSQWRVDDVFTRLSDLNLSPSPSGSFYFWKVRSFDLYGNGSAFSARRKFHLN